MKSVILTKYGAPEVLKVKEFKNPEPLDNEVRIKVHYAGINFAEIMLERGDDNTLNEEVEKVINILEENS